MCYNWSIFCLLWWFSWSWICCWFRTPQRLNLNEGMCTLECWKEKKSLAILVLTKGWILHGEVQHQVHLP
jgi:hypothetical protein